MFRKASTGATVPANPTQLQHLTRTDGVEKNYTYDANGNMVQAGDNRVTWTTFNQPLSITNRKTGTTANFTYDASQQRVQQMTGMEGKSETTTYVSAALEVMYNDVGVNDRITQYKHHIYAGNVEVATHVRTLKGNVKQPDEFRYLHHDALGSVDTITDSHGDVIQRIAYSPFGTRKVTASNDPDLKAWTARGFTGHEHLDGLGLIHMNARLYDPEIGRFLSPDTYIQAPDKSQNYNRYAYVMNNPLKYTDPSGHFFSSLLNLIDKIGSFLVSYAPTIVSIATAAILGPGATFLQAVLHGAAAGFMGGLVGSGSLRGALEGAFWGGITAGAARGIGHGFGDNITLADGSSVAPASPFGAGKWLAHGIAQGAISELRGGNFQSGFVGAVAGSVAGDASGSVMSSLGVASNVGSRTAVAGIFGGLASKASGGSFADGAVSAAFTHLFNDELQNFPFYENNRVEVFIHDSRIISWGSQFGHVSISIGNKLYSMSHGGLYEGDSLKYILRQRTFRDSIGFVLNVSPQQASQIENTMKSFRNTEYDLFVNSCTSTVMTALNSAGVPIGDPRFESWTQTPTDMMVSLGYFKNNTNFVSQVNFYGKN